LSNWFCTIQVTSGHLSVISLLARTWIPNIYDGSFFSRSEIEVVGQAFGIVGRVKMGEGRGLDILFITFDVILDDMKGIPVCNLHSRDSLFRFSAVPALIPSFLSLRL